MGERETIEILKEERDRLQKENNELRLAEGYIQQHNENLKSKIRVSIGRLMRVAQELEDTKGFLGRSKTIKGVRERVDELMVILWPSVYEGEPPWSKPTFGKAEYLGGGVWRNPFPDNHPLDDPPPPNDHPRH